jgi:hypothetical protein
MALPSASKRWAMVNRSIVTVAWAVPSAFTSSTGRSPAWQPPRSHDHRHPAGADVEHGHDGDALTAAITHDGAGAVPVAVGGGACATHRHGQQQRQRSPAAEQRAGSS